MKSGILLLVLFCMAHASVPQQRNLEVIHEWKELSFDFPSAGHRAQAVANGNLVPANAVPIDVFPHYTNRNKTRAFITIPRFKSGIPFSLATVKDVEGSALQAYPGYEWHNSHGSNCDQITSAFRMHATECNQLFVIDSGMIGATQLCPPQLLVFDLQSDQLVYRYRFDSSVYVPVASLLVTLAVVVQDPPPRGRCQNVMVYIADVRHHGLVVYDSKQNAAWRVENKFLYPDPDFGTHTIAGESFNLMDGVFGLSTDKTHLYFNPLASISEYAVPLSVLNNRTNWINGPKAMPEEFRLLGARTSECAAAAMDSRNNLYCVTFNPIKLIGWNVQKPYKKQYLREVADDAQLLQFVSGMKAVKGAAGGEELWLMSNRFQKVAAGTLNMNEVNFRVLKRQIDDIQNNVANLNSELIFT